MTKATDNPNKDDEPQKDMHDQREREDLSLDPDLRRRTGAHRSIDSYGSVAQADVPNERGCSKCSASARWRAIIAKAATLGAKRETGHRREGRYQWMISASGAVGVGDGAGDC